MSGTVEDRGFVWLLIAVSAAFALILWPFAGAILWGTVLAILFAPLYRRLVRVLRKRRTLAALATLAIIVVIVIVPLTLVTVSLVDEASGVYDRIRSGELSFGRYLRQVLDVLPGWALGLLDRLGLTDAAAVQARLSAGLAKAGQFFAVQAVNVGQNTLEFVVSLGVMLYLLFFLLRDGEALVARVRAAVPLSADRQRALFGKFAVVVRATVKGNIAIALLQGALGGLMFWFLGIHAPLLWAVLMAFLSLLPAVGAGLVWAPVALYFLATGALAKGAVLIAFGVLVIGLVDNLLRPILVGKDTRMPDYVVLVSTLGGIAVFGLNGFVIGPLIAAMFIAAWDLFAAGK
jgi:predicted PurR-regulated permease PerM